MNSTFQASTPNLRSREVLRADSALFKNRLYVFVNAGNCGQDSIRRAGNGEPLKIKTVHFPPSWVKRSRPVKSKARVALLPSSPAFMTYGFWRAFIFRDSAGFWRPDRNDRKREFTEEWRGKRWMPLSGFLYSLALDFFIVSYSSLFGILDLFYTRQYEDISVAAVIYLFI